MSEEHPDVEEANTRFYRAFEALDLAEMDKVWAHADHVACVHPGWPLLRGWDAIRGSWETIFKNTGEIRFTLTDVHVVAGSDLAWVTCTENILSQVRGRVSVTSVLATNIFEQGPDECETAMTGNPPISWKKRAVAHGSTFADPSPRLARAGRRRRRTLTGPEPIPRMKP